MVGALISKDKLSVYTRVVTGDRLTMCDAPGGRGSSERGSAGSESWTAGPLVGIFSVNGIGFNSEFSKELHCIALTFTIPGGFNERLI